MRLLARNGAVPCSPTNIPTDLVEANCVPSGFMVPKGWDGVVDYYKNVDASERWIPWSRPVVDAPACSHTEPSGKLGTTGFVLKHKEFDSFWHDIPLRPTTESTIINFVVEIPMYMTAKMEVQKEIPGNVITQDTNKDGSARYYTYGTPFFNYGLIPQTWEDPSLISPQGNAGDNDPLDVMEIGSTPLKMGSINPCKVLGSLELIDEGETDHKIICIAMSDPDAARINSMSDLDLYKPGTTAKLIDWLKRYKTSDGKPENSLAQELPTTQGEALSIIQETHERWQALCGHVPSATFIKEQDEFWLKSPGCKGVV